MQICQEGTGKSFKKTQASKSPSLRGAPSLDKFPRIGYTIKRKAGSLHESVMKNAGKTLRVTSASSLIGRGPNSTRVSGERHCGRKKQRPNKPLFILSFGGCALPHHMKAADAFGASLLTSLSFYAIILSRWWVESPKSGASAVRPSEVVITLKLGPLRAVVAVRLRI